MANRKIKHLWNVNNGKLQTRKDIVIKINFQSQPVLF